jgi:hypothetical protein
MILREYENSASLESLAKNPGYTHRPLTGGFE